MAVNLILSFMIACTVFYTVYMMIYSGVDNINLNKQSIMVYGYALFITGFLFLVAGFSINIRLKRYFKDFYADHKVILWVATFGLSIPIMTRGIFDVVRFSDRPLDIYISNHEDIYSPIQYLVGDLIPLTLQLSSLVFGYIRKNKNAQARK